MVEVINIKHCTVMFDFHIRRFSNFLCFFFNEKFHSGRVNVPKIVKRQCRVGTRKESVTEGLAATARKPSQSKQVRRLLSSLALVLVRCTLLYDNNHALLLFCVTMQKPIDFILCNLSALV